MTSEYEGRSVFDTDLSRTKQTINHILGLTLSPQPFFSMRILWHWQNIANDGFWICKTNRPVFTSWNYCQWIHVLKHSRLHDCAWRLNMMDCSGFCVRPVWPAGRISSLLQRLTPGSLFSVQMITCPRATWSGDIKLSQQSGRASALVMIWNKGVVYVIIKSVDKY